MPERHRSVRRAVTLLAVGLIVAQALLIPGSSPAAAESPTDTEPPVTTSDATAVYDDIAAIYLTGHEEDSVIAWMHYRDNEDAVRSPDILHSNKHAVAWGISVTGYGHHVVEFWSEDSAGSVEDPQTVEFAIDDTSPPGSSSDAEWEYIRSARITLSAYDGTALVATGKNYPDALAASPLAAAKGWPLYLASPTGLSTTELTAMGAAGVTDALILGGTGAVPVAVETQLDGAGIADERLTANAGSIANVTYLGGLGALSQAVRDQVEAILD